MISRISDGIRIGPDSEVIMGENLSSPSYSTTFWLFFLFLFFF